MKKKMLVVLMVLVTALGSSACGSLGYYGGGGYYQPSYYSWSYPQPSYYGFYNQPVMFYNPITSLVDGLILGIGAGLSSIWIHDSFGHGHYNHWHY